MAIHINSASTEKGRKISLLRARHLQQRRGHRRRPSFLKCSMKILVVFLVALVIVYAAALSSFIRTDKVHERELDRPQIIGGKDNLVSKTNERFETHRSDKLSDGADDGNDDLLIDTDDYNDDKGNDNHDDDDDNNEDVDMKRVTNVNEDEEDDGRVTIGVASTITECGSGPFIDGAAVLKYSLDVHSRGAKSKFKYRTYILYHPSAKECVSPLEDLGYTLLERPTPIKVEEMGGPSARGLRERIVVNGCCGEKELIKLEAFRLTEHPIVVHLDLDVLINKPMDDMLDFMMNPKQYKNSPELLAKIPIMWPEKDIPDDISLVFTKDYNVVAPKRHDKPYQGGFFVIKPSINTYNDYLNILREGDYDVKHGWGGKVGPFHGGMTIQGLLPWYYEYLHPGRSVELNRCKYNNMNDKPKLERNNGLQICRTNEEECEDCRFTNEDDIFTFHFTICQKPWSCLKYTLNKDVFRLCRVMNRKWYMLRSEMEASWGRSGTGPGAMMRDHYKGFCSRPGEKGYQPIRLPYGTLD